MEKIIKHIALVFILVIIQNASIAQEWTSSLQFEYGLKTVSFDSSQKVSPTVTFPGGVYDNSFKMNNIEVTSESYFVGFGNDIILNRNIITTSIGAGLHIYDHRLRINKVGALKSTILDSSITTQTDQAYWDEIIENETNEFGITKNIPALRLSLGYKRELFRLKSFSPTVDAGLSIERRFNIQPRDSVTLEESYPYVYSNLNNQLNHKQFIFNPYIGLSLRLGTHIFAARYNVALGRVDDENGVLNMKETSLQVSYAKTLGLSKIGKEQVIYGEYQHLGLAKSSEYRKGDKFSYLTIGFDQKAKTSYTLDSAQYSAITYNNDSLTKITNGYDVTPNINFGLAFNTYATHRWMVGLGIDFYQELYNSYGTTYDSLTNETGSFSADDSPYSPTNELVENRKKTFISPNINTAIYISKRILRVDPYVKGSAAMVMNYDVPPFLKENSEWRSTSFFPIYKVGIGVDIRLRIKSSKFLIVGLGADYNLNPHTNFIQYTVRLGYYRKKKLKNQTY